MYGLPLSEEQLFIQWIINNILQPDVYPVIHQYNTHGKLLQTFPAPRCGHGLTPDGICYQFILHLNIEGIPYLAVSCSHHECNSITSYNTIDGDSIVAYSNPGRDRPSLGHMCRGPKGVLIAADMRDGSDLVSVFNCSTTPFTLSKTMSIAGVDPNYINYLETDSTGGLLIASNWLENTMCATALESGQPIWMLQGDVMGKLITPGGMCPNHRGRLCIADGNNGRILILDGSTGCVLQVIQLGHLGAILNVSCCDKQSRVIVRHRRKNETDKVSYFSVKFRQSY